MVVTDEFDEFGQEASYRGGSAVEVDVGVEQFLAGELDAVGHTDVSDVTAGAGSPDGLHHRFLGADRLDDRVGAEPVGELFDVGDAVVASCGDDVAGSEVEGELLAVLVAAHGDDGVGSELAGGEDAEQAHCAISDHGHRLAGPDLGGDGGEPAGAQHIGRGQQAGDQLPGGNVGGGDQGAVS